MNGLREFYADADAKKIKALEAEILANKAEIKSMGDQLQSKDEQLLAKDEQLIAKDEIIITTLKAIMVNMNLDFDHAFAIAEIDPSLKEEYRKLIEE